MRPITIPNLETDRLRLEKITQKDQQNIFNGSSHTDVIKYYGVNYTTYSETKEQMNWYSNLEKSASGMWWAIYLKSSKIFCGAIGY